MRERRFEISDLVGLGPRDRCRQDRQRRRSLVEFFIEHSARDRRAHDRIQPSRAYHRRSRDGSARLRHSRKRADEHGDRGSESRGRGFRDLVWRIYGESWQLASVHAEWLYGRNERRGHRVLRFHRFRRRFHDGGGNETAATRHAHRDHREPDYLYVALLFDVDRPHRHEEIHGLRGRFGGSRDGVRWNALGPGAGERRRARGYDFGITRLSTGPAAHFYGNGARRFAPAIFCSDSSTLPHATRHDHPDGDFGRRRRDVCRYWIARGPDEYRNAVRIYPGLFRRGDSAADRSGPATAVPRSNGAVVSDRSEER